MSKMTAQDAITFYKAERSGAKLGQQLFAIPRRDNEMIDKQVFYYYVGDRRRVAVDFTKEICFHLNYLRIKSLTAEQYLRLQESTTPMEDLINAGLINPFLLFVGGHFIPWENITIICSQERYDLLISGLNEEFFDAINGVDGIVESVYVLALPDNIEYRQGGFPIDGQTLFAFDDFGRFVKDGFAYITIQNFENNVELLDFQNPTESRFLFAEDPTYKYFPENVFMFNDGLYLGDATCNILGTAIQLFDGTIPETYTDLFVRIVHNTKLVTPTYDHMRKLNMENTKEDIFKTLSGEEPVGYMELIKESFDPKYDTSISAAQNNSNILDYLAKYDSSLFNKVYNSNKSFIELEVSGAWILAHRDEDGYLKIPRRFQDGVNYYIILMVNGELYKYYRNHFYKYSYFYCPVQDIVEDDRAEIWYFKNASNFEFETTISEDQPFMALDQGLYNEYMKIFCKDTTDTYFSFPADGDQMFPVDYHLEFEDGNKKKLRIRFEDDFYYGKKVYLSSSRRFQYFLFSVEDTSDEWYYSIDLGEKFKYCNQYDHYIVFFNGKRMINDLYRLVLPYRTTTPFTKAMLYSCVPIRPGDRVEVFYIPNHFVDIYDKSAALDVPENGLITIDKSLLGFSLDKDLCSVWVNSKKLPSHYLKNISSTKMQIVADLSSTKDVRITTMIGEEDFIDEFKTRFQSVDSNWDKAVDLHGNPAELMGYDIPTITDTEEDAFPEIIPTVAIMNEIIRDWYVSNAIVDTTGPFLYDYDDVDQSAIIGTDSAGNTLLAGLDSNREDSLDIERPWP